MLFTWGKGPMEYQGRNDPWSNLSLLRGDLQDIKDTQEKLAIAVRESPGAFEHSVAIPDELAEEIRRLDVKAAQDRADNQFNLLHEDSERRNEILENIEYTLSWMDNELCYLRKDVAKSKAYLLRIADALDETNIRLGDLDATIRERFQLAEKLAAERNDDLIRTIESSNAEIVEVLKRSQFYEAKECYENASAQYETGHLDVCRKDLVRALDRCSTLYAGWLLLGRVMLRRYKRSDIARVCFHLAADHALRQKDFKIYAVAMIRLSHLERSVGNVDRAHVLMVEAVEAFDAIDGAEWNASLSKMRDRLRYEKVKAFWAVPAHQTSDGAMEAALELAVIKQTDDDVRYEVAMLPLFQGLREFCPWLNDDGVSFASDLFERVAVLQYLWKRVTNIPRFGPAAIFPKHLEKMRALFERTGGGRTVSVMEVELIWYHYKCLEGIFDRALSDSRESDMEYSERHLAMLERSAPQIVWLDVLWQLFDEAQGAADHPIELEMPVFRDIAAFIPLIPRTDTAGNDFTMLLRDRPQHFGTDQLTSRYRAWLKLVADHEAERRRRAEAEKRDREARERVERQAREAETRKAREAEEARRREEERIAAEKAAVEAAAKAAAKSTQAAEAKRVRDAAAAAAAVERERKKADALAKQAAAEAAEEQRRAKFWKGILIIIGTVTLGTIMISGFLFWLFFL